MVCPTPELPDDSETVWSGRINDAIRRLSQNHCQAIELLSPYGSSAGTPPKVILAGSFNPLHRGHCRMAEVAAEVTGKKVHFELSVNNADKPPVAPEEVRERLLPGLVRSDNSRSAETSELPQQPVFFPHGLLLSNSATFVRKAAEYGEVTFAVGVDTWIRIGSEAFYPAGRRDAAIDMISAMGCRFLVFGRQVDGEFLTLKSAEDSASVPATLKLISDAVPEPQFRVDTSSTSIRNESNQ